MTDVTLGVDIGTSSSKAVLVDSAGSVVARATRRHQPDRPRPGHVEMAGELWWTEFVSLSRELVAATDATVIAVGVSGMGPCALLTDEAGQPLRPAILYGVDTRAGKQIDELNRVLGAHEIQERAGSALSSQAVGPKLAWIAEHEPDVWANARRLFMPASWLGWKLTGSYRLDHHSASQCTPLYDPAALDWIRPWADRLTGAIELPDLAWTGEATGKVTTCAAHETTLPAGIPVTVGTIDAWSEAISVGANRPGDLMLMYGTTMFLIAQGAAPMHHPTLWGTVGTAEGSWSLAGGMATSGAITDWLSSLSGASFTTLTDEAAQVPAGADGLLMLPYFAGERTPVSDPDARGTITGLTLSHTRGALYRAALEATAFGVRHNIAAISGAGVAPERVVAVGGGASSRLWTQIVSDATGHTQEMPRLTIGASYGSAFLAAQLGDVEVRIDDWNPIVDTVQPGADSGLYDQRYGDYLELYRATSAIQHRLATAQRTG